MAVAVLREMRRAGCGAEASDVDAARLRAVVGGPDSLPAKCTVLRYLVGESTEEDRGCVA